MSNRIRVILALSLVTAVAGICVFAAEEEESTSADSSKGLPEKYAAKYLIKSDSISPDKQFAVIYPRKEVCLEEEKECQNYLVALHPFRIVTKLETDSPEFENKNHGGMTVAWLKDSAAALVTLEAKWGPGDIFLFELRDGKLVRSTNLLKKIHERLEPDYRAAKAGRFNDYYGFIFDSEEQPAVELAGSIVKVHAFATTDPKNIPGEKAWEGKFDGVWDIPQAKFTSQKVTRLFAGVRKSEEGD